MRLSAQRCQQAHGSRPDSTLDQTMQHVLYICFVEDHIMNVISFSCETFLGLKRIAGLQRTRVSEGGAHLPEVLQNVPDGCPIGVPEHKPPTCHLSLNAKQLQLLPQLPMISASLKDCCAHV